MKQRLYVLPGGNSDRARRTRRQLRAGYRSVSRPDGTSVWIRRVDVPRYNNSGDGAA